MAQTSQQQNEPSENQSTTSKNKSIAHGSASNEPRRISNQALDVSSNLEDPSNIIESNPISNSLKATSRYQPSKSFILKCRTELESLLDSIKSCYHEEIKGLHTDKLYADYILSSGEEFKKPIHRCVLLSRAFKLYTSLRTFELPEVQQEKDIVLSEFQKEAQLNSKDLDIVKPIAEDIASTDILNPYCVIPESLIQQEQLSSFLYRIYLNLDISDEETQLNQTILQWIKVNRPEILKPTKKFCPDHKESFRTIQPDFENLSISDSPAMSGDMTDDLLSSPPTVCNSKDESQIMSELSTETHTPPGLTRTETFEKISKSNSYDTGSKEVDSSVEIKQDFSLDSTIDKSTDQEPYAPVTRTGLRPKTFTTPVDARNCPSPNLIQSSTKSAGNESLISDQDSIESTNNDKSSTSSSVSKPAPAKRSSISTKATTDVKHSLAKTKTTTPVTSNVKTDKITTITRAQPISMERSQSPGTKVIKGSGRNFIAANKKLVSQIEKKVSMLNEQTNNKDNGTESNQENPLILETYCIDDVIANMDKFALISQSKLADALSKMFIDKLIPDTIIIVNEGRQIDAHRCILAARSAYLSEVISKKLATCSDSGALFKQKLRIEMTDFSYSSVYFSLLHIYSGAVKVPDDVDLDELARLTNLLHVTTLRQVCMQTLRMNYCHFFHKPCKVCCLGVLKTLPLGWRYDYTDLYQKCLQWIGSNFASIFCLKEFSDLKPNDLIEECYSATMNQLTPDNIIPKTIECQKLLKNLPHIKWTESVICLVGRLLEDFCHYVAENYEKVLVSESFMNLKKNCWECEVLEENLLAAMNHLKPDSGCKTLIQLNKIECASDINSDDCQVSDSFSNLIVKMRKYCERYLLKEAAAVVHCSSWKLMSPSLKKKIKDQAILSTDFDEPTRLLGAKPKLISKVPNQSTNKSSGNPGSDGVRSPSSRSTPDSKLKSSNTTLLPQPKNKTPASRHVKILK